MPSVVRCWTFHWYCERKENSLESKGTVLREHSFSSSQLHVLFRSSLQPHWPSFNDPICKRECFSFPLLQSFGKCARKQQTSSHSHFVILKVSVTIIHHVWLTPITDYFECTSQCRKDCRLRMFGEVCKSAIFLFFVWPSKSWNLTMPLKSAQSEGTPNLIALFTKNCVLSLRKYLPHRNFLHGTHSLTHTLRTWTSWDVTEESNCELTPRGGEGGTNAAFSFAERLEDPITHFQFQNVVGTLARRVSIQPQTTRIYVQTISGPFRKSSQWRRHSRHTLHRRVPQRPSLRRNQMVQRMCRRRAPPMPHCSRSRRSDRQQVISFGEIWHFVPVYNIILQHVPPVTKPCIRVKYFSRSVFHGTCTVSNAASARRYFMESTCRTTENHCAFAITTRSLVSSATSVKNSLRARCCR